ncbi:hypothetical protein BKA63DRAFT_37751 [Paraphoma chrysanthemicola]|nr:hypothetical protein BKA63DRAFT_37751 [Paraphoma chrysanthemicola]
MSVPTFASCLESCLGSNSSVLLLVWCGTPPAHVLSICEPLSQTKSPLQPLQRFHGISQTCLKRRTVQIPRHKRPTHRPSCRYQGENDKKYSSLRARQDHLLRYQCADELFASRIHLADVHDLVPLLASSSLPVGQGLQAKSKHTVTRPVGRTKLD